jgi:hypothetical protein
MKDRTDTQQITSTGNTDRPFSVDGNTFTSFSDALQRSCDIQNNACADVANGGNSKGVTVSECSNQESKFAFFYLWGTGLWLVVERMWWGD